MKEISSRIIGIDQGDAVLFSDFEDDGEMWTGSGDRERRMGLTFERAFFKPPSVFVALSVWDIDNETNARADITADNITEHGFEVVFKTWGDTRIARARVRWMAIGPLQGEDDWTLY